MAEQTQAPVEPQLVAPQETEGVPKVVEAVVDEGEPNSYKIVRSATGKNYVEVRACRAAVTLNRTHCFCSGGAGDTAARSCKRRRLFCCVAGKRLRPAGAPQKREWRWLGQQQQQWEREWESGATLL